MKELSDRAMWLLWIVGKYTEKDWTTGKLDRFFVPSADCYYYRDNDKSVSSYISGMSDASRFRGLEKRGLIKRPNTSLPNAYIYELTENGLLKIQELCLNERFS